MSCLAHVFEEDNALARLEAFTSLNGPRFYGLPVSDQTMDLVKGDQPVAYPDAITAGDDTVTVFDPGVDLFWRVDKVN